MVKDSFLSYFKIFLPIFIFGILLFLSFGVLVVQAETDPAITECKNFIAQAPQSDLSNPASKAAQCKTLIDLFAELAEQQAKLADQQGVTGSLQGDIKNLTGQITQKKTQIKAKIAHINVLTNSISEKKATIQTLSSKIQGQKNSLAQLLRKTNELDRSSLVNFMLSAASVSQFYSDLSDFGTLESQIKESVDEIKTTKSATEKKKAELEVEQNKTIDEKQSLLQVQDSLAKKQSTQKTLLSISKDKEASYKKLIAEQQAKVAQIKARLFQLAGGAKAIRFDVALQFAEIAKAATGIDPAFLLAIATQESNLGANVGSCYLTDPATGAGVSVKSGKSFPNVMKPSRDVPPFLDVVSRLGFDPMKTFVSCPIPSAGGWGGAMGPAQFIASTWRIFENRLSIALKKSVPNPWEAEDAFMASAMYLTDLGAIGDSYTSQIRAACKYYGTGGSSCSYGKSVMKLAVSIQSDIDYLKEYGVSRR